MGLRVNICVLDFWIILISLEGELNASNQRMQMLTEISNHLGWLCWSTKLSHPSRYYAAAVVAARNFNAMEFSYRKIPSILPLRV